MKLDIAANLADIRERIERATLRSGRLSGSVKLVAVCKTHPAHVVREAIAVGQTVFGENRVQEADPKITEIGRANARWHLIGHLQSNKARRAVQLFDVIESVDSVELATRLERICDEEGRTELPVFIQVDLAGEAEKSGVIESDLPELAAYLKNCKRLKLQGLMVLPPYFDDPEAARPYFTRLRDIRDKLDADGVFGARPGELSMGMSHDFEVAIEEGATVVRVGTAIFGER